MTPRQMSPDETLAEMARVLTVEAAALTARIARDAQGLRQTFIGSARVLGRGVEHGHEAPGGRPREKDVLQV